MKKNNKPKAQYKLKNWPDYNQALKNRGSVTLWLSEEAQADWYQEQQGKRGRPCVYSDGAITCALTLGAVFKQPLRGTQGFVESLLKLMDCRLCCPDYSTLCRRRGDLSVSLPVNKKGESIHVVLDSTGLKVYGEGEWKVRKHGVSKRRTWRKLHLAIDADTHEILGHTLTLNDVGDCEELPTLLNQTDQPIASVSADGAYDTKDCYKAIFDHKAVPKIPPREGAVVQCPQIITHKYHPALKARDDAIKRIQQLGNDEDAKKQWKIDIGYHRRSLSETAMFRRKTLFPPNLSARKFQNQIAESTLIARAMNIMTHLGMPDSYLLAA